MVEKIDPGKIVQIGMPGFGSNKTVYEKTPEDLGGIPFDDIKPPRLKPKRPILQGDHPGEIASLHSVKNYD